jgi:hypothetical protein
MTPARKTAQNATRAKTAKMAAHTACAVMTLSMKKNVVPTTGPTADKSSPPHDRPATRSVTASQSACETEYQGVRPHHLQNAAI